MCYVDVNCVCLGGCCTFDTRLCLGTRSKRTVKGQGSSTAAKCCYSYSRTRPAAIRHGELAGGVTSRLAWLLPLALVRPQVREAQEAETNAKLEAQRLQKFNVYLSSLVDKSARVGVSPSGSSRGQTRKGMSSVEARLRSQLAEVGFAPPLLLPPSPLRSLVVTACFLLGSVAKRIQRLWQKWTRCGNRWMSWWILDCDYESKQRCDSGVQLVRAQWNEQHRRGRIFGKTCATCDSFPCRPRLLALPQRVTPRCEAFVHVACRFGVLMLVLVPVLVHAPLHRDAVVLRGACVCFSQRYPVATVVEALQKRMRRAMTASRKRTDRLHTALQSLHDASGTLAKLPPSRPHAEGPSETAPPISRKRLALRATRLRECAHSLEVQESSLMVLVDELRVALLALMNISEQVDMTTASLHNSNSSMPSPGLHNDGASAAGPGSSATSRGTKTRGHADNKTRRSRGASYSKRGQHPQSNDPSSNDRAVVGLPRTPQLSPAPPGPVAFRLRLGVGEASPSPVRPYTPSMVRSVDSVPLTPPPSARSAQRSGRGGPDTPGGRTVPLAVARSVATPPHPPSYHGPLAHGRPPQDASHTPTHGLPKQTATTPLAFQGDANMAMTGGGQPASASSPPRAAPRAQAQAAPSVAHSRHLQPSLPKPTFASRQPEPWPTAPH